ncbi:MAG TPA: hypothetical protein VFQ35_28525 [Polyangiaceae bacterium]|nr:hypothetical protein [Polyangiaceae bacterium]
MLRRLSAALLCAFASTIAGNAAARVEASSGYSKPQTFSCALRLLRVDRGYEVVEKDQDAAYVLFRYPISGQKEQASGSLEIVETAAGVRVFVQLPKLPEYHEALLRDALLRKLREEYGPPPNKPPAEKPKAPPDKEKSKPKGDAPEGSDEPPRDGSS